MRLSHLPCELVCCNLTHMRKVRRSKKPAVTFVGFVLTLVLLALQLPTAIASGNAGLMPDTIDAESLSELSDPTVADAKCLPGECHAPVHHECDGAFSICSQCPPTGASVSTTDDFGSTDLGGLPDSGEIALIRLPYSTSIFRPPRQS